MSLKVDIHQEVEPSSPWEYEESIGFISTHKRFQNRNTEIKASDFSSMEEIESYLKKQGYIFQKVFCYDHSGVTIKAGETNPFHCQWDSFPFGYLILSKAEARSVFLCKRVSKKTLEKAQKLLIGFSETWNSFLIGDIYGWEITDEEGEVVDSCYGYYGYKECEKAGQEALSSYS